MSNYFDQDFLDNVSGAIPYVSMTGVGSNSNSRHSFTDYKYVDVEAIENAIEAENALLQQLRDKEDLMQITYTTVDPKARRDHRNMTPCTIMVCDTIGLCVSRELLRVLFDTGSGKTLIHRSKVPKNAQIIKLNKGQRMNTIEGTIEISDMVYMRDIRFPELEKNRRITGTKVFIFDSPCRYDVILGNDLLDQAGIDILYSKGVVDWLGNQIPMRDNRSFHPSDLTALVDALYAQEDEEFFGDDFLDAYAAPIMDAKYEEMDVEEVADGQKHLTPAQREDLKALFRRYRKLFDGSLGVYPHKKCHIELEPNAEPVFARQYPVPQVHKETFIKELLHLESLGVLKRVGASEWGSPTFITPKKDGRVRWVSDLRALNRCIKRKKYPLPVIMDILKKRKGYEFMSKLDISMQYYTFELTEESKDLTTIVTPIGLFRYERLPMGLKCSPDFAQEVMENVMRGLDDTDVYIDDIGCFSDSWDAHLKLLDTVLSRLQENGFTCNPLKCEWGVKETDWLGYWLTPVGLKPWSKKVEAIAKMSAPTNQTELRSFIGAVNYYKDLFPSRAHVLAPLTSRSGKKRFEWTDDMQKAFEKMKAIVTTDTLCRYPNHNLPYVIKTDASDYQLGAVILQEGMPVAYYSRKLTGAQRNYTTTEKELLSIVMVLKEYRSMLLGTDITIYTDHKNLTFENLTTQRNLRWRCFVEEYSPVIKYIEGPTNVLADALSRVPRADKSEGEEIDVDNIEEHKTSRLNDTTDSFHSWFDEPEMLECMLNLPEVEVARENPLNYEYIREQQQQDANLLQMHQRRPALFFYIPMEGNIDILVFVKQGDDPNTAWRIALPSSMVQMTIRWFHEILGHCGSKRLRLTLNQRYYHPEMRKFIDRYACDACQRYKLSGPGYGLLPERNIRETPWDDVAVDMIGPWNVPIGDRTVQFKALTIIDPVTNLTELVRVSNKTSAHVASKFEQTWLARYPFPKNVIHDNGGEFTGWEFQRLLERLNIKDVPITSKNPQSNAIVERMHQTVGNILRTLVHTTPPEDVTSARNLVDEALSTAQHALRAAVSTALGSSPGALVFGRDMFLDVPMIADWHLIARRREQMVNESLRRENMKRRRYDYVQGQRVMMKVYKPNKLEPTAKGPYRIVQVHVNGTVTLELRQAGANHEAVLERINIRRIIPYKEPTG